MKSISTTLAAIKSSALGLLLFFLIVCQLYADNALSNTPKIRVNWVHLSSSLSATAISVTNVSDKAVRISPSLDVVPATAIAGRTHEAQRKTQEGTIQPTITGIPPVGMAIGSEGRGLSQIPIDIEPGETKDIKLQISDDNITLINKLNKVVFVLTWDEQILYKKQRE